VSESNRPEPGKTRLTPVLKLRRLAGVSDSERSEEERESAAEIPSAARELWRKRVRVELTDAGMNRRPPVLKIGESRGRCSNPTR